MVLLVVVCVRPVNAQTSDGATPLYLLCAATLAALVAAEENKTASYDEPGFDRDGWVRMVEVSVCVSAAAHTFSACPAWMACEVVRCPLCSLTCAAGCVAGYGQHLILAGARDDLLTSDGDCAARLLAELLERPTFYPDVVVSACASAVLDVRIRAIL